MQRFFIFSIVLITLLCNPLFTHAQTNITPTVYCLGVPCTMPQSTHTPTSTNSITPTSNANPTVTAGANPCLSSQASTQSHSRKKHKKSNKNGHISAVFAQLLTLILDLLKQFGFPDVLPPQTPLPSQTPHPTVNPESTLQPTIPCVLPSVTPHPQQTPVVSLQPTGTQSPTQIPTGRVYPWHTNIVSTTFWVGELFNASLADGSQVCSTYDTNWAYHWSGVNAGTVPSTASGCAGSIIGGCDGVPGANNACSTEKRTAANGYFPTKITPKENPFYLDLPFDDVNDSTAFAQRCQIIPWANDTGFSGNCTNTSFSYMKNRWVRIVGPNTTTCYGQIEDAGPSHDTLYHDSAYVFGSTDAQPIQGQFNNAGADVSPALNGCLGFSELDGQNDKIKWQFVDDKDVPAGPWKNVVTTSGVQ